VAGAPLLGAAQQVPADPRNKVPWARCVIAAATTQEKLAGAAEHGADATVDYSKEQLTDRVMALTEGRGADVCFHPVGGSLFDAALSSLGSSGAI
jgi:NADPH2:quinone reductase